MDFGYYPPSEFELGHGKKFYEPNVGNFFYREESWGTSFVGDSDYGITGGSFNDGIVDLITISPLSGGTFQGISLRVKPDRFAELLEQAGMAFEVRREDEIVTIALEPSGNEPADSSKPHVEFVFEDENTELPAVRWIAPGSHELGRYLREHGWRATSDGFALDGPDLVVRLHLNGALAGAEYAVANLTVEDPRLGDQPDHARILSLSPASVLNNHLIGKPKGQFRTSVPLREGYSRFPKGARFARLHAELSEFAALITPAWIAEFVAASDRFSTPNGAEDTARLAQSLLLRGETDLADNAIESARTTDGSRQSHLLVAYVPSENPQADTVWSITTDPAQRSIGPALCEEFAATLHQLNDVYSVTRTKDGLLTIDMQADCHLLRDVLPSFTAEGLAVVDASAMSPLLVGDEVHRFEMEYRCRNNWASESVVKHVLRELRRAAVISGTRTDAALILVARRAETEPIIVVKYLPDNDRYWVDLTRPSTGGPSGETTIKFDDCAALLELFLLAPEEVAAELTAEEP